MTDSPIAPTIAPALADAASPPPPVTESNSKTGLTDAFREHFSGDAPIQEKAKNFAKSRPWASAALVGVAAIALLNTLRGRGRS